MGLGCGRDGARLGMGRRHRLERGSAPLAVEHGPGATSTSQIAYESHMIVLGICVVIGIIVFGAMAYAMFKFRKSKGAVAAQFTHNTKAEIVWTTIPVLILIGLAWPATHNLIRMYDTAMPR